MPPIGIVLLFSLHGGDADFVKDYEFTGIENFDDALATFSQHGNGNLAEPSTEIG